MLETTPLNRKNQRVFCDITNVTNNEKNNNKSNIETLNELFQKNISISPIDDSNKTNSVFKFDCENCIFCKDNLSIIQYKQNKVFLPRVFQHHEIPEWLRARYLEIDPKFEFFVNSKFKTSPCNSLREQFDTKDDCCIGKKFEDTNWIDFKYSRIMNGDKEILCRFCYGKNWINESYIYEHLFGSHGIVTSYSDIHNNSMKISVRLLPLPINYKTESSDSCTVSRKTKVLCGICQEWIRLGNGSNSINRNNNIKESIKWSKLPGIHGFYENYFRHYISCKETEQNKIHFIP
ncbi:hypothetical protein C6P45_004587 [Maudiozyma exigua]|uniref:Transcription regulator Rua1 C-terminal domain-containing protein n=1 Tax=Maudiozyma exigua TaxID=34358 RepID=A0A9P6WAL4_MAUEX|nr:hypothetical protein C6P45_004587 [Kazachstania exigua]